MRVNLKLVLLLFLILLSLFSIFFTNVLTSVGYAGKLKSYLGTDGNHVKNATEYDVWCIFTKTSERKAQVLGKFSHMLVSMLEYSSVSLTLHLIVDSESKQLANNTVQEAANLTKKIVKVEFYDVATVTSLLDDIISSMKPHFSPKAGSYYSDSLFYISLGLHRIAPKSMSHAVLLDIDLQFEDDIASLFDEFNSFTESNLFALAPELAPVYYHLLSAYRTRTVGRTDIGRPCCTHLPPQDRLRQYKPDRMKKASSTNGTVVPGEMTSSRRTPRITGQPGVNSGVVLLRLDRIRSSLLYKTVSSEEFVRGLAEKYIFKGHLGDQDFYSLLSWEVPGIIRRLDCGWNRQLCTWWRDHGYPTIHAAFSYCPNRTRVYHANCNSRFPANR